ncbi:Ethylmalonyl-CoA decarboxylase [Gryllus bimaculatus]|nr:Ethylmalonyl-CoA decarboxylase [Gryllus bimaculatus]
MNSVETFPLKPSVNYYEGPENSLEEIEMHLLQFTGGTIDLNKSDSGIATLCINHYKKRNAISGKMMVELGRVVAELEAWRDGKGVIVYGSGGTFCSGGDLDMARLTGCAAAGFKMSAYMTHVLDRLERLPLLTVALIEGSGSTSGLQPCPCKVSSRLIHSLMLKINNLNNILIFYPFNINFYLQK